VNILQSWLLNAVEGIDVTSLAFEAPTDGDDTATRRWNCGVNVVWRSGFHSRIFRFALLCGLVAEAENSTVLMHVNVPLLAFAIERVCFLLLRRLASERTLQSGRDKGSQSTKHRRLPRGEASA
jgi:hypothetical protein